MDISDTLILIQQLTHYDSQPWAVSHSSLSHSSIKYFPFISIFPMMSHCVSFYYSFFLIYHLICHVILWWNFWKILWSLMRIITYLRMLLSCSGFPMYIRRLRERTIKFRIYSQLSYFQQGLNLTVLITASGFVSTLIKVQWLWLHHQSVFILLHQAYFSIRSQRLSIFWGIHWIFLYCTNLEVKFLCYCFVICI